MLIFYLHTCVTIILFFCNNVIAASVRQDVPKLVIDHDGGADDAMGLIMALLYERHFHGPKIVALTTVHGNVNESQVYINTQRILTIAKRQDIPIYRGASKALLTDYPSDEFFGKDGLGDLENVSYEAIKAQPLHAALGLLQLSKQYEGELIIITLGTLTNIALAISLDPGFIRRIKHIYVGAGNIYDKRFNLTTEPEFNVLLDAEAYQILAQNAVRDKVTAIPYSAVLKDIPITRDWRINTLGKIPSKVMKALNSFERVDLPQSNMWQMLDPFVVAVVLDSCVVGEVKLTKNSVQLCADGDGMNQRGITTNEFKNKDGNMNIVYSGEENTYKDLLIKIFSE